MSTGTVTPIRRDETLFQRLARLRAAVERVREELAAIREELPPDDDLRAQLQEADGDLAPAIDYMTPTSEHVDRPGARLIPGWRP